MPRRTLLVYLKGNATPMNLVLNPGESEDAIRKFNELRSYKAASVELNETEAAVITGDTADGVPYSFLLSQVAGLMAVPTPEVKIPGAPPVHGRVPPQSGS